MSLITFEISTVNESLENDADVECGLIIWKTDNRFVLYCKFCEKCFVKLEEFVTHTTSLHKKNSVVIKSESVQEIKENPIDPSYMDDPLQSVVVKEDVDFQMEINEFEIQPHQSQHSIIQKIRKSQDFKKELRSDSCDIIGNNNAGLTGKREAFYNHDKKNKILRREDESNLKAISYKLKNNIYKISEKRKGRSDVWEIMAEILNENNEIIPKILCCRLCKKVFNYNSQSTTNLWRHNCCVQHLGAEKNLMKYVDMNDKNVILNRFALLCIQDVRPFTLCEGAGFKSFVQTCAQIGAKYGENVNIDHMLPSDTSVSIKIENISKSLLPKIILDLSKANYYAASTDLWTDNYIAKSYIAVTLHYIYNDEIIERVLSVNEFNESHTADKILTNITTTFNHYKITDLSQIVFVTDKGSDIVKALKHLSRINCFDLLINNILSKSCEQVPEILKLFECCEKLVRYSRMTNSKLKNLKTKLKNGYSTRWISKYEMFLSINDNINDVLAILREDNQIYRIEGISTDLLKEIVNFLHFFKVASEAVQASKTPTIHLVFPYYRSLLKHCTLEENESDVLKELKNKVKYHLENTVPDIITIYHKTATFLYPPCKLMAPLNLNEKQEIYNFLKELVGVQEEHKINTLSTEPTNAINIFVDFADESLRSLNSSSSDTIDNEIVQYLSLPMITGDIDVLRWWADRKLILPNLYKASLRINCIPATSATSQRCFSLVGNIMSDKRSSIYPEHVNDIIISKSNFDLIEFKKDA